eukprot:3723006-Pyramimonas_sp.AAC.1
MEAREETLAHSESLATLRWPTALRQQSLDNKRRVHPTTDAEHNEAVLACHCREGVRGVHEL